MSDDNNKLHQSNFLVTINTNVKPMSPEHEEELSQDLFNAFESALDMEVFEDFITFRRANEGMDRVEQIEIPDWATEVGEDPQGSRVHLHALIKIRHRTKIHLNREAIKSYILEQLKSKGVKNIYVNIQFLPDNELAVKQYIHKRGKPNVQPKVLRL